MKVPQNVVVFLNYPYYKLNHIDDLSKFKGIPDSERAYIYEVYNKDIIKGIISSLQWVDTHPQCDLVEIYPEFKVSNETLHAFNKLMLATIVKKE